ncbi:hypothetical protein M422DRAFT_36835 [Sphaerobolus stellatus SS14]|uniref:Uncharacterized protein n=1 Tax=Sphaerobolus stellatus (strain SS14) TaxID=990650 RepID=A0A0C9UXA1_SPHS4|nr:hypothetical protein M422DRAFT_36835 [Sphaerobolus stellatus SS14]
MQPLRSDSCKYLDCPVYCNWRKPRQTLASAMQLVDESGMVHAALTTDVVQPENKKEIEVPVDQISFHKFLYKKNEKKRTKLLALKTALRKNGKALVPIKSQRNAVATRIEARRARIKRSSSWRHSYATLIENTQEDDIQKIQ